MRKRRSDTLAELSKYLINPHDTIIIQIIRATGQLSDFVFNNSMDFERIKTDLEEISNPRICMTAGLSKRGRAGHFVAVTSGLTIFIVNQRAKLTRVLGKTALKSFHPRLYKIRYFIGAIWGIACSSA